MLDLAPDWALVVDHRNERNNFRGMFWRMSSLGPFQGVPSSIRAAGGSGLFFRFTGQSWAEAHGDLSFRGRAREKPARAAATFREILLVVPVARDL